MIDVNPTSAAISKIRPTQTIQPISSRSSGAAAGKVPGQAGHGPVWHLGLGCGLEPRSLAFARSSRAVADLARCGQDERVGDRLRKIAESLAVDRPSTADRPGYARDYRDDTKTGAGLAVSQLLRFAKLAHRSVVERAAVWRDRRAGFAEVAGVAEVLAGGPIRSDLQAPLAGLSRGGAVTGAYARAAAGALDTDRTSG